MFNFMDTSFIQMFLTQFMFSVNALGIGGSITRSMRIEKFYVNVGFLTSTLTAVPDCSGTLHRILNAGVPDPFFPMPT